MTKTDQKIISPNLLDEIKKALESVRYGSIEIFVQNKVVTQITVRNIHKTSVEIEPEGQKIHVSTHSQRNGKTVQSSVVMQKNTVKMTQT